MKDTTITQNILYIGADDKDIDLFESQYQVPNGVSYNSYLIMDEKIAVMDTVDARRTEEWLANLEKALAGKTPDYLVVSHMEPDHASNIQKLVEKYPNMKVVGNAKTFPMINQFLDSMNCSSSWHQWYIGRKLWLLMKRARKFYSQQMASENSVHLIQKKTGHVKQDVIISILLESTVYRYKPS